MIHTSEAPQFLLVLQEDKIHCKALETIPWHDYYYYQSHVSLMLNIQLTLGKV